MGGKGVAVCRSFLPPRRPYSGSVFKLTRLVWIFQIPKFSVPRVPSLSYSHPLDDSLNSGRTEPRLREEGFPGCNSGCFKTSSGQPEYSPTPARMQTDWIGVLLRLAMPEKIEAI